MNITTKGRYGLRAIVDLSVHGGNGPVSVHSIAKRQGVSDGYLEQLLGRLKKAGLVNGVRGAAGGYRLARPAGEITVGDILRALEGSLSPFECPAIDGQEMCENSYGCVTKDVWKKLADSLEQTADNITLEELKDRSMEFIAGNAG